MSKDIFSDLKGTTTEQMRQKSIEMGRLKFTLYNLFSFIDVFLKKRCFYTFCVFLPNIEQVNFLSDLSMILGDCPHKQGVLQNARLGLC